MLMCMLMCVRAYLRACLCACVCMRACLRVCPRADVRKRVRPSTRTCVRTSLRPSTARPSVRACMRIWRRSTRGGERCGTHAVRRKVDLAKRESNMIRATPCLCWKSSSSSFVLSKPHHESFRYRSTAALAGLSHCRFRMSGWPCDLFLLFFGGRPMHPRVLVIPKHWEWRFATRSEQSPVVGGGGLGEEAVCCGAATCCVDPLPSQS